MNQILTIFKKDARHLWPEILASVILTIALVRIYPNTWLPQQYPAILLSQIATALVFLVPIGWCVLITRLIQSESLVGDRQFWITRPYEWQKLIAAKALFIFVFLSIPTFIAHSVLVKEAGFHPLSYLPGLLYNLLLLTGVLVLPLITLATITSTFVRMVLTLLGIIVAFIAVIALTSSYSPSGAHFPGDNSHLTFIFFVSILVAVVLLQYATRRLWLSRTILVGIALLGVLASFVSLDNYFVRRTYPPSTAGTAPVQFSYPFPSTPPISITTNADYGRGKNVSVSIPVQVSGIAAGQAITTDNVLVSIDAPNKLHWTSHWQPIYNETLLPATQVTRINIELDRDFFNKVQSLPLSVHLTLALSLLQSGETTQLYLGEGDFTIPGIGICWLPGRDGVFGGFIQCRSAVRQPHLSYVQTYWSKERCTDSDTPTVGSPDTLAITWVGSLDLDPAELSIAPIWAPGMNLSDRSVPADKTPGRFRPHFLCPGTPIAITPYHLVGRAQTQLTIPDLRIPPPQKPVIRSFDRSSDIN